MHSLCCSEQHTVSIMLVWMSWRRYYEAAKLELKLKARALIHKSVLTISLDGKHQLDPQQDSVVVGSHEESVSLLSIISFQGSEEENIKVAQQTMEIRSRQKGTMKKAGEETAMQQH